MTVGRGLITFLSNMSMGSLSLGFPYIRPFSRLESWLFSCETSIPPVASVMALDSLSPDWEDKLLKEGFSLDPALAMSYSFHESHYPQIPTPASLSSSEESSSLSAWRLG